MRQIEGHFARRRRALAAALVLLAALAPRGVAAVGQVVLKDGRVLEGKFAPIVGLVDDPRSKKPDAASQPRLILMCDDNLRRVFVPSKHKQQVRENDEGEVQEKFNLSQHVARSGERVLNVGDVIKIGPFDEFGRRVFRMNTKHGPRDLIQAITTITPKWTRLEGVKYVWDQRIATTSIPRDALDKILYKQIDATNVEQRLKIARFYLQSERYPDAEAELVAILKDFPDLQEQIDPVMRSLRQLAARQVLAELKLRESAGQYQFVQTMLSQFYARFGADQIAGEILQEVREKQEATTALLTRREEILQLLETQIAAVKDETLRERLEEIHIEIAAELNLSTLDRLSAFHRLSDDPQMLPQEKMALAVSGWLVGNNAADSNLGVALSLYDLRQQIKRFLVQPAKVERERLLDEIRSLEGADAKTVAQLVAYLKPPFPLPEARPDVPGLFELTVPGLDKEPDVTYFVQLPPEYDPYRRYPTIVTLHSGGTTPLQQIDWFAGGSDENKARWGQATRHGYIVIAPAWAKPEQRSYEYSAREHHAVLATLRDACRRFAIDTDRVFLSGHSMGGDAAWDIGLAHPDQWAGVIPIVAVSDRYCSFYWENARYVPFYVVSGEFDGGKMLQNGHDLDRYFIPGFPVTVVEYLGRGHEHFSDEVPHLFDWMGRYRRDFFNKEFACRTMREWDNYFWWVEAQGFPSGTMVAPEQWPAKGKRPLLLKASVNNANGLRVQCGAESITVWLAPELIDFSRPIDIRVNGNRLPRAAKSIAPDLGVLLDDVRSRGERLHPFWAKVEMPSGKVNLAGR